jgi:hypothetical protein
MEAKYQVIESLLLNPDASRLFWGEADGDPVMAKADWLATIGVK